MSATAVVPPPSTSSLIGRLPRLTTRARRLLTVLNLHLAAVAALGVITLYLLVHLLLIWQDLGQKGQEAIAEQRVTLRAAEIAEQPLEGIDGRMEQSTAGADAFYVERLPYSYSGVLAELGAVVKRTGVKLSRVQYAQQPAMAGTYALTQVNMDASIGGDYRAVVGAINALERDRMFFVIAGVNLTGQQTGQVNLRVRLTTYLRPATENESLKGAPAVDADTAAAAAAGDAADAAARAASLPGASR